MVKYLTPGQMNKLYNGLDAQSKFFERNQAMVCLLVNTGLRVGEMVSLDVGDVLNKKNKVRDEVVVRKEISKNGKERCIPLNDTAKKAVAKIVELNERFGYPAGQNCPLLISRKYCRLTTRQIQRIVGEASESADLDVKATPHTLRHAFAKAVYKGGNLKAVQQLLGHTFLTSTQIYIEVSKDELQKQVNKIKFALK